jgi:hypothetical protein
MRIRSARSMRSSMRSISAISDLPASIRQQAVSIRDQRVSNGSEQLTRIGVEELTTL